MKHPVLFQAILITALSFFCSCEEKISPYDGDPEYKAKKYLAGRCIDTLYYWNDQVRSKNADVKIASYDIEDLFTELLYKDDRWSWMEDGKSYKDSQTGVISDTWGVNFGQAYDVDFLNSLGEPVDDPQKYLLRVRFIYPGSPLESAGVTRGAILEGIGDSKDNLLNFDENARDIYSRLIEISPQTFTFKLIDGRDTTFTASKSAALNFSPVHRVKVFNEGDFENLTEPVGYINYLNFKTEPFLDDLQNAFDVVENAGARKIILDLRYNTGGYSTASDLMMKCLSTKDMAGKVYVSYKHNKLLSSLNSSLSIDTKANSKLEDIYIITGKNTASASEVIINALRPYFGNRLHLVGGKTYGKPNGMYVCVYPSNAATYDDILYVFYPICFYNNNSLGESIPDDGFDPDISRPDDLFSDWSANEELIATCLFHIANGNYPDARKHEAQSATKSFGRMISGALIQNEIKNMEAGFKVTQSYWSLESY